MADNSTVKITIDVIDANSGDVVATVTKNLSNMGSSGKSAGEMVAAGAKKASDALKATVVDAQRSAKSIGDIGAQTFRAYNFAPLTRDDTNREEFRKINERYAQGLQEVGDAGTEAGQKIARGMHEAGGHTLTNLDKVRLLRDDLGIRIPRAMENVIARSALASSAIGAIGSGLIALGAIEIFSRIGRGIYEFYKSLTDVNAAIAKFAESSGQSAKQELFDNASIETTRNMLTQVRAVKASIERDRTDAGVGADNSGSLQQYLKYPVIGAEHYAQKAFRSTVDAVTPDQLKDVGVSFARGADVNAPKIFDKHDDNALANTSQDEDLLARREALLDRQKKLKDAEDKAATAGAGLQGRNAEQAKTRARNAIEDAREQTTQAQEEYNHTATQRARILQDQQNKIPVEQRVQVYTPSGDAGAADRQAAIAKNNAEFHAKTLEERYKQDQETLHLEAEAHAASLRGEAKYAADLAEEHRKLKEERDQSTLDRDEWQRRDAALDRKYQAERLQRLENEHAETARLQWEAAGAGNTGMARVDAQTSTRLAGIAKEAPGFSDSATRAQREAAVRQQADQEKRKEAEAFSERLAQYEEGHADHSASANERIEMETKRTIREIEKAWQEEYGILAASDQRRVQSRQAVDAAEAKIQMDATRQMAEARQTVMEQTLKVEDEGRRAGQSKEREHTQAIVDEYNERYRALEDLRAKDSANADLYRRQEIAAKEIENGKLLDMQRQQAEKLAGMLRGYMGAHPLQALQRQGEEVSAKYLAQLINKSSAGRSITAELTDPTLPGRRKGRLAEFGAGAPPMVEAADPRKAPPVVTTSSNVSAASTTLTASTAVIHVGQATFTGVGGAGGTGSGGTGPGGNGFASYGAAGVAGSSFSSSAGGRGLGLLAGGDKGSTSFSSDVRAAAANGSGDVGTTTPGTAASAQTALGGAEAAYGMGQSVQGLGQQLYGAAGPAGAKIAKVANSKLAGQAGTGLGGAMGLYSAVESNGGFGGVLSGASAGAKLGSLFGPAGTLIGAGVGALIGAIGFGGAQKAKQYEKTQVRPRIQADELGFGMGTIDYSSAYDDLTKLDIEARKATQAWGPGGRGEYLNRISPEIHAAMAKLTSEQKSGRSKYGMTAAQFDMGGPVSGFGDMATSGTNGWIHAQRGEFVLQQQAALNHYQAAQLINGGATHSDMARYYGGSSAAATTAPPTSSADVNMHFHSHDARGTMQLFMDNKHVIREALNQSYAENSGGADIG